MRITESAPQSFTNLYDKSEKEFSIKATAKAFKILSDGLYTDKIKAIIRELSCNAYDSHVAAGCKEKPFDVSVPTHLDRVFKIRDYGTGLSDEDVTTIYTTYFESTKTNSNDYIGALGLGSKSPFCYTDSFVIISYFNGEQNTYTAYLNEHGCPSIMKVSTETTIQPNGVEICFPVDESDVYTFTKKAIEVYSYFDVLPNINTGVIDRPIPEYEGKHFKLFKTQTYGSTMFAKQGQVVYPININSIPNTTTQHKMLSDIRNCVIIFDFDIGDLNVAASREALSMDIQTAAKIKEKLDNVVVEFVGIFKDKILKSEDIWEALRHARTLNSVNHNLGTALFPITVNGNTIDGNGRNWSLTADQSAVLEQKLGLKTRNFQYDSEFIIGDRKIPVRDQNRYVIINPSALGYTSRGSKLTREISESDILDQIEKLLFRKKDTVKWASNIYFTRPQISGNTSVRVKTKKSCQVLTNTNLLSDTTVDDVETITHYLVADKQTIRTIVDGAYSSIKTHHLISALKIACPDILKTTVFVTEAKEKYFIQYKHLDALQTIKDYITTQDWTDVKKYIYSTGIGYSDRSRLNELNKVRDKITNIEFLTIMDNILNSSQALPPPMRAAYTTLGAVVDMSVVLDSSSNDDLLHSKYWMILGRYSYDNIDDVIEYINFKGTNND